MRLMLFICFVGVLGLLQSCSDDVCDDVSCLNGGVCVDGTCDCPEGFSGTDCSLEDLCITQSTECLNGGTCVDGECDCPIGYSGENCQILSQDNFIGTWNGEAQCTGGTPFDLTYVIEEGEQIDQILLTGGGQENLLAHIISADSFNLEPIIMDFGVVFKSEGTGKITETGELIISIDSFTDDALTGNCTFIGAK